MNADPDVPESKGLVSVDDHVMEPATLWTDRIPKSFGDRIPHVVTQQVPSVSHPGEERWADVWHYEDVRVEVHRGFAAAGFQSNEIDTEPMTFGEMRPGCLKLNDRLADMDIDNVEVSLCFPNAFVRFCGQRFLEAQDRELALLCVRAYNDWLFEEWCGPSEGRLLGAAIIPLWDSEQAGEEVLRNAARGATAVCFSEIPARLGLPSMYSGYWDPFFAACEQSGTVINVHIGSSSAIHTTSDDAPMAIRISNHFGNSAFSLSDWIVSGAFDRFPNLRVAFSEGQAGWIPYLMSRLDGLWASRAPFLGLENLKRTPSEYLPDHVFACVFDDPIGMTLIDVIGENNICWETDYPHNDSTWPHSAKIAANLTRGLTQDQKAKVLRLNAAHLYNIERILQPAKIS